MKNKAFFKDNLTECTFTREKSTKSLKAMLIGAEIRIVKI